MADLPFGASGKGVGTPEGVIPPWRDTTQGGAPAGEFFTPAELPIAAVHGGSGFSEGFSPSPSNPALPAPGSFDGDPLAPTGNRR